MPQPWYVAVIDREEGERNWSILFPDFPEVASVAERAEEWADQARDALLTAIEARQEDGEPLPKPTPMEEVTRDWPLPWRAKPMLVAVAVEHSSKPVRVNISVEESLLRRIDAAAERRGMTRSGFLAEGARRMLAEASGKAA